MHQINLHNYEAYLLDYFENRLDAENTNALKNFLNAHPELDIYLDDTTLPYLNKDEVNFENKAILKKDKIELNEDLILSYLENLLDPSQKIDFEKELSNNSYLREQVALFQKTYLVEDKTSHEMDKTLLLKSEDDIILSNRHIAFWEGLLSEQETKTYQAEISENEDFNRNSIAFGKTFIKPESDIQYPNKAALKRGTKVISLWTNATLKRIAALLLLILSVLSTRVVYNHYHQTSQTTLANKNEIKTQLNTAKKQSKELQSKMVEKTKPTYYTSNHAVTKIKPNITISPISQDSSAMANQHAINNNVIDSAIVSSKNTSFKASADTINQIAVIDSKLEESKNTAYVFTIANIEVEKEMDDENNNSNKNKFWKKLLNLSTKAKSLGVKGLNAEQKENNTFYFAFNNLSIEKK